MREIEIITQLLHQLQQQREEIALLKKHISVLEEKLSGYEHPKNSSNSSTPPSQDPFRGKRTMSLREKSGKKRGGQAGHEGVTLTFSENPDAVINHKSDYCSVCGRDLSGGAIIRRKRTVVFVMGKI